MSNDPWWTCAACGWKNVLRYGTCCNCATSKSYDGPLLYAADTDTISYGSGMNRSDNSGKPRYDLMSIDMLTRWAELMARNVASKGDGNWRKAKTPEDLARCRESAFRHFVQWFTSQDDEDHAAACIFNISTAEYIKERILDTEDGPPHGDQDGLRKFTVLRKFGPNDCIMLCRYDDSGELFVWDIGKGSHGDILQADQDFLEALAYGHGAEDV